jgi:hypothetical protein
MKEVNSSNTYKELPPEGLIASDLIDTAAASELVKDIRIARGR